MTEEKEEETSVVRIHKNLKEDLDKLAEKVDVALWDLGVDLGYTKLSLILSSKLRSKGIV